MTGGTAEEGLGREWVRGSKADGDECTGSLCCETAEEAKTLIPSLQNKISDVDLQDLLDEISKLRNFTE